MLTKQHKAIASMLADIGYNPVVSLLHQDAETMRRLVVRQLADLFEAEDEQDETFNRAAFIQRARGS